MQLYNISEFLSGPIKQCPMSKRGKSNYDSLIFVFFGPTRLALSMVSAGMSTSASSLIIIFYFFSTSSFVFFSFQGTLVILSHNFKTCLLSIESSGSEHFL